MIQQTQQFMEGDTLHQAVLYHHRERRKSHAEITQGLFQSSSVAVPATPDLTALPKTSAMTVTGKIQTSGVPAGQFFGLGGTTLSIAAGALTLNWSGGSASSAAIAALAYDATGDVQNFDFAIAIYPGKGQARVWLDGFLAIRLNGVTATEWAGAGSLSKGGTNIAHVGPLRLHSGQVPRHFD